MALTIKNVTIVFCRRCGREQTIPIRVNDNRECGCPNFIVPDWQVAHKLVIG